MKDNANPSTERGNETPVPHHVAMRDSHPGLFRAMLRTGGFAIINGIGMLVWPSRLPVWCPPTLIGIISLVLGAVIIGGALAPTRAASMTTDEFVEHPALVAARVALGILAAYYVALGIGLFIRWDPDIPPAVGTVTGSLDRVLLYVLAGGVALDLLCEPSANPVSAKTTTTSRRGRWRPWSR